ncbi:hypothetical protein SCLCIDRAFT_350956 [Scleroderma citrinum Foug A]|uniref:Uncharacterized protein n=1 Tax=Scleroderma citrinum Foug A TaxID=1036808 RepID=A0A0C2YYG6_9AGAM|nr:hypothetical protein SCLCIDRAFT_350956 [Scleroderma citrinum Foug A]
MHHGIYRVSYVLYIFQHPTTSLLTASVLLVDRIPIFIKFLYEFNARSFKMVIRKQTSGEHSPDTSEHSCALMEK